MNVSGREKRLARVRNRVRKIDCSLIDLKRMQAMVDVMIEVVFGEKAFNLGTWCEQEEHNCGTIACFGGWLAASSAWRKAGFLRSVVGSPEANFSRETYERRYYGDITINEGLIVALFACGFDAHAEFSFDQARSVPVELSDLFEEVMMPGATWLYPQISLKKIPAEYVLDILLTIQDEVINQQHGLSLLEIKQLNITNPPLTAATI